MVTKFTLTLQIVKMTGCNNCNADCFDNTYDGCVGYSGGTFEELGISNDMTVKAVLTILANKVISLTDRLNKCKLCDDYEEEVGATTENISLAGIGSNSTICSANITNTNIRYTVVPGQSAIAVQYSLEDIINNLPSGYRPQKINFKVYGNDGSNTVYVNTDKNSGSFSLPPAKFPLRVELSMAIGSPCGTIYVDKDILINSDLSGNYSAVGNVKDYGKEEYSTVSQTTYNDVIRQEIVKLNREVSALKTLNVRGTTKVPIVTSDTTSVLQSIINKIDQIS